MVNLYFLTVNYNSSSLLARLLKSLSEQNNDKYQVVVVNNSPEDRELSKLDNQHIKIIEANCNLGFGKACNIGLNWINNQNNQAIVWLINPDAYFEQDVVKTILAFFKKHSEISILGTIVINSAGEITSAGGTFTSGSAAISIINTLPNDLSQDYIKTDWVSGCSLLINCQNFSQCPQFCDRYFLYYEDLDFCLRYGRQGHQIAVTHLIKVIHDTSSITNRDTLQKYKHITHSYLIHIEKHGNYFTFLITNMRMLLNSLRLLVIKPPQGLGKLTGFYNYWRTRITDY